MHQRKPLVLLILDGFGYRKDARYNAIAAAKTPHWDAWWKTKPHALLDASGLSVGLPEGQMGNSEVGHMHIGAGRTIYQNITKINKAIHDQSFFKNPIFIKTIETLKQNKKRLHIMGLLSPGGVHSHEDHLFAFLKLCWQEKFCSVVLHLFLDGRDTPPKSALASIKDLEAQLKQYPVGEIASISGRYYAMDRDKRYERIEKVFNLLVNESASNHREAAEAIELAYKNQETDEFILPSKIGRSKPIEDGDAIFFFNFRADRARQLTEAFVNPTFQGFIRQKNPQLSTFISMTEYDNQLKTTVAFPPELLNDTLGEVLSKAHLKQLRLAETEKYAHVTFFLNGGIETVFENEERILINSERIPTYDLSPKMRAPEITKTLKEAIESNRFDVIICNYANADMIGHTGNFKAAIESIECLDSCLQEIALALEAVEGHLLITADHGNAEMMFDEATKQVHTAHTTERVPFLYLGDKKWRIRATEGKLSDVAPTILKLLGLNKPSSMTGQSLLERINATN